MTTKYLIYTGIFLLFGACSNKAIYYNPDQKRSIYFNWDLSKYVSNVAPDTVFFSFAIYEEKEVEYRIPVKSMECLLMRINILSWKSWRIQPRRNSVNIMSLVL